MLSVRLFPTELFPFDADGEGPGEGPGEGAGEGITLLLVDAADGVRGSAAAGKRPRREPEAERGTLAVVRWTPLVAYRAGGAWVSVPEE